MEYHTEVSLETLAEADPCSLADASRLRAVYAGVLDADPQAPLDDVARLHALFDVALDHGLVSVVVHYVQEVCLDPLAVSSDPTSAFLMDGHVVAAWVDKAFARLRSSVEAAGAHQGATPHVMRAAAMAHDLWTVTCALREGAPGGVGGSEAALLLWRQYLDALAWLLQARVPPPHHVGPGAWATSVAKRRDAARPGTLFLDDLLQAAGRPAYPQPDAGVAAKAFFLSGPATDSALAAKAGLFYYYLLDAGAPGSTDAAAYATSCGLLSASPCPLTHPFAAQVRAGFLLDESCERPAALDRAAALLACGACGGGATPLQFVSSLLHRGARGAALDVMRSRAGGRVAHDLEEASAWVTTCLQAGQLHQAFAHAQLLCDATPDPQHRAAAASALIPLLASYCEAHGTLGLLLAFPWCPPEEELLASWLLSRAGDGALAGEAYPALYASRRRGAEAAHAHAVLQRVDGALGGPGAALPREQRERKQQLVEARTQLMARQVGPTLDAAAAHTVVSQVDSRAALRPPSLAATAPPPQVAVLLGGDASGAETLGVACGGAPPGAPEHAWALSAGVEGAPTLIAPPPAAWAAMRADRARHAHFAAAVQQQAQHERSLGTEVTTAGAPVDGSALPVMRLNFDAVRGAGPASKGVERQSEQEAGAGGDEAMHHISAATTASPQPAAQASLFFGRVVSGRTPQAAVASPGGGGGADFSARRATRSAAAYDTAGASGAESLLRALAAGTTPRHGAVDAARARGGTPNKRPRKQG